MDDRGFFEAGVREHATDPERYRTPVLGRLASGFLVFFLAYVVARFAGLSGVTGVIVGVGVVVLMELALNSFRQKARAARMEADLERQRIAEEDARVAREKALARAKARGAFDRFGSS